jgi:hypothetical protein
MKDETAAKLKSMIATGLEECECRRCECMAIAIEAASRIIDTRPFEIRMKAPEKDCFECDPCHGADVYNLVRGR